MIAQLKPVVLLSTNDKEAIQLKCKYDVQMLHNRKDSLIIFIANSVSTEENEIFVKSHDAVIETLLWMN